jgi:DNA mismatch endonuclease (patch repair protein)
MCFGSALYKMGIRYRKQLTIIGKPDFGIKKYKLAIFIDGDFWHGNIWKLKGYSSIDCELRHYSKFWREKIRKNILRDEIVNQQLKLMKWKVFRFWESEIEKDVEGCARKVERYIYKRRTKK